MEFGVVNKLGFVMAMAAVEDCRVIFRGAFTGRRGERCSGPADIQYCRWQCTLERGESSLAFRWMS